jgi:hypothetical protein
MWTRATWDRIINWLRKVRMNRRTVRRPHYVQLHVEHLTERIVPTNNACIFLGTLNSAWNNVANWAPINGVNTMPDDSGTDTVTIENACVLNNSSDVNIAGLTIDGGASLTVASNLTVAAGGTLPGGNGSTSVAAGGGLIVGNPSNPGSSPAFDTTTLTDLGTVTVGAAAGGSVGTLDATTVSVGDGSGSGTFYIGDPGTGSTGTVDVSGSLSVGSSALLQVGGVGSGGVHSSNGLSSELNSSSALSFDAIYT